MNIRGLVIIHFTKFTQENMHSNTVVLQHDPRHAVICYKSYKLEIMLDDKWFKHNLSHF